MLEGPRCWLLQDCKQSSSFCDEGPGGLFDFCGAADLHVVALTDLRSRRLLLGCKFRLDEMRLGVEEADGVGSEFVATGGEEIELKMAKTQPLGLEPPGVCACHAIAIWCDRVKRYCR